MNAVMPGLVPGIHALPREVTVDGRDKPGHDVLGLAYSPSANLNGLDPSVYLAAVIACGAKRRSLDQIGRFPSLELEGRACQNGSMNQLAEFGLEPSEQAVLDEIGTGLRARGWTDFVTVLSLLGSWRDLSLEVREYTATVDDYINDLSTRDALEIVLTECPEPIRTKLKSAIEKADKEFFDGTQHDAKRCLATYFRIDPASGWWWWRIPSSGSLAEYLVATP